MARRRFDARELDRLSEFIVDEWSRRKNKRADLEAQWQEIDRQVSMKPDKSFKLNSKGEVDREKAWIPELELPGQALTLEILTADARRLIFPDAAQNWFSAHAAVPDALFRELESGTLIQGNEVDLPSKVTVDNVNKLVEAQVHHWHRQYDFFEHIDRINAEAFKYSVGLGRGRRVKKRVLMRTAKGMDSIEQIIPALIPRSIRSTYLDDRSFALMQEGFDISPSPITELRISLNDLVIAANKGSTDPEDESGGWRPDALIGMYPISEKQVSGDDVVLLEYEGDAVIPRQTVAPMIIHGAIITVVIGRESIKDDAKSARKIVRLRLKDSSESTWMIFPYHYEDAESAYAASPLMKGRPIQKAAVDALTRLLMVTQLNAEPPLQYDRDDHYFAVNGPVVFPGVKWPTTGDVVPVKIGDPTALLQIYIHLLGQYADVTGMDRPRLGAQTVSHTTAFAKNVELNRGQIRTVDYVRSMMKGPLTKWLGLEWSLGRPKVKNQDLYNDAYRAWVTISGPSKLPKDVVFEVFGAGTPSQEATDQRERLQALQLVTSLEQLRVQMKTVEAQGIEPVLDLQAAIEQVLRMSKWIDVDVLLNRTRQTVSPPVAGQALPDLAQAPAASAEALQTLVEGINQ